MNKVNKSPVTASTNCGDETITCIPFTSAISRIDTGDDTTGPRRTIDHQTGLQTVSHTVAGHKRIGIDHLLSPPLAAHLGLNDDVLDQRPHVAQRLPGPGLCQTLNSNFKISGSQESLLGPSASGTPLQSYFN